MGTQASVCFKSSIGDSNAWQLLICWHPPDSRCCPKRPSLCSWQPTVGWEASPSCIPKKFSLVQVYLKLSLLFQWLAEFYLSKQWTAHSLGCSCVTHSSRRFVPKHPCLAQYQSPVEAPGLLHLLPPFGDRIFATNLCELSFRMIPSTALCLCVLKAEENKYIQTWSVL